MAILPLTYSPDPLLKQVSKPVEKVDDALRQLAADMFETMYLERGIGLAAVQVGRPIRLLVADVTWREDGGPGEQHALVNPEILRVGEEPNVYKEGCLSFPEQFGDVERPKTVRVRYQDLTGAVREEEFDGLLATCIQHEIDHLNGITFVDHLSGVKRDIILRKMKKAQKMGYPHHHDDHGHEHVHGEHCNH